MNCCAVGVTAAVERANWGAWDEVVTMAPQSYARAVQQAGGLTLILPPDDVAEAAPDRWLDRLDALLLAGGQDIDPASYGQRPHPETKRISPERDRFEIALARAALDRGLPLLGVCRGMQLLNVALGGDLVQHLPDHVGHDGHRRTLGTFGDHQVRLEPGSLAARAVGDEWTVVKSHHHQGLARLGEGLVASGWSGDEDTVEAVEIDEREHPFALGILWHPEEDQRSRVIGALVAAAKVKT